MNTKLNKRADLLDELSASQARIEHLAALFLSIRNLSEEGSRTEALADLGLYTADEWASMQLERKERLEATQ